MESLAFNPLPVVGPSIYTVPDFRGATIVAGGSSAAAFQFPRDLFVSHILVVPQSGTDADLASLTIQISDETGESLIGTGTTLEFSADCCALFGSAQAHFIHAPALPEMHPFPLQRPIKAHDVWTLTVGNTSGADIVVAAVLLYIAEPRPPRFTRSSNL